jgi:predicted CopG family antitoxin
MHKKLTITLDERIYEGLHKVVGRRKISQFIEDLVRSHIMETELDEGYRRMAQDEARETEALDWSEGTLGDVADETR